MVEKGVAMKMPIPREGREKGIGTINKSIFNYLS